MQSQETCFTPFRQAVDAISRPERFTFPFYYDPHPLCVQAATELQQHLATQDQWQHNFGLNGETGLVIGKMFGVLVVENVRGELGYLAAFSGKLANQNLLPGFVPPVFDMLAEDSFFHQKQSVINGINEQLERLESNPEIHELNLALTAEVEAENQAVELYRQQVIAGRKKRKMQRAEAEKSLNQADFDMLLAKLSRESVGDKNRLKALKLYWQERVDLIRGQLTELTDEIGRLKERRKTLSANLQQALFQQYCFLNKDGEEKSLADIFRDTAYQTPPAGAGECAAPKLLHYCFKWQMKPVAMAEFWWGQSPKSEIRKHKNFYGACVGKCQPILGHMLQGIAMDENPLLSNPAVDKTIEIIYQDEDMLVVNKPADLLSVPGKSITDSVYTRMKQLFPAATGPLIVHRLDMSTSGLMVLALNKKAHKNLQKQFIERSVKKRYQALLQGELAQGELVQGELVQGELAQGESVPGEVKQQSGTITLPLRTDFDDRPRQLVCREHGKPAETFWQVTERGNNRTKVYLYPKTGRTHQLRVHCAHPLGLNLPIVGDDLYGDKGERLHLHAQLLELTHPRSKQPMSFSVDAEF
ncbi:RNA pseudouridine synthase [Thalassomonas viridans]|uniref:RNA pseudouridine synthase n=1 Tax=Thalassomonas viridans TaxID=137584 RepID=A0AAE9Z991_9GAMM|nr:RluA family pseudouridine synthase [Thalassomonas viridans]WDE08359.1 RNA pseudouridine synthase [Thalassomonas viridans]